jgi:hypothetical protein
MSNTNYYSTSPKDVTKDTLNGADICVISGTSESSDTHTRYGSGTATVKTIKDHLRMEQKYQNRWAVLIVDGKII